jgi:ABC-type lipoprotein export system ATPase subunit
MISLIEARHKYNSQTVVELPDLNVEKGEHLAVLGLSGSGKTTLLHVLAGLLRPAKGELTISGTRIYQLSEAKRDAFRGKNIGVIFQQLHLVDSLTVEDNIALAQYLSGKKTDKHKIRELCEELGIADKLKSHIDELSQGQRQRVGIARAVINEPELLLADEPTSSLDDRRAEVVIRLLKGQAERTGAALIVSTHDRRVKNHFINSISLDTVNSEVN